MLEGTLETFTLADIFQLLALTKKAGRLRLVRDGREGCVLFDDGQVYYATADTGRIALGRRLVGAGMVSTAQLREVLEAERDSPPESRGLRLGRALTERGVIGEDTLEAVIREQVQDAVFDLMRWSEGVFHFDVEGELGVEGEPVLLAVTVENLIMEGSRRLEEWASVREKVPGQGAVVAMAPLPGDSRVEVSLTPEEWRLLTLVDGRRTVGDLIDVFGQGQFTTGQLLHGMVEQGLLEIRDPERDGPPSVAGLLEQQRLLGELEAGSDPAGPATAPSAPRTRPATARVPVEAPERPPAVAENGRVPAPEVAEAETPAAPVAVTAQTPASPSGDGDEDPERRLTTDPAIDADLIRRLIDGVKGL